MSNCISLLTDFGADSPYVAQMKGAILSIAPNVNVVDVTHSIGAQDVLHGAFVLADSAFHFPPGSIHVAVVDPGVGTQRAIVAALIDGHWFVAPDNGLLTGVAQGREVAEFRRVENREFWRKSVSNTFHGRDIMCPVAAHLSLGIDPAEIGPSHSQLMQLPWPTSQRRGHIITGEVVLVDSFGNLITNILRSDLDPDWNVVDCHVDCGDITIESICETYGRRAAGETVALFGSSDRLEIAAVSGNAAASLGIERGAEVVVRPHGG